MKNQIQKTIELNASIPRVWKALTDYKEFGEWFRVNINAPFVEGQASTGNMTYPGYEHVKWAAVIQKIDSEKTFSFTWHPYAIDPNVDYSNETPTLVEFTLEKTATGTRLTVTESGFDKIPEHRFAEAFRMNEGGWTAQMTNIQEYVSAS